MTKIQICFAIYFKKDFLGREFHSQSKFMRSWIKINTNTIIHNLFLYFNNFLVLRKSGLHLKRDANQFWFGEKFRYASHKDADLFLYWEKIRSTSYKNANLFLYWEKFKSTSYKDAYLLLHWEKFRSTSYKDADLFCFKKKIQIYIL